MNDLIKIEKQRNSNILSLREMYDKVEANVRALNSEGINPSHFGPLLIPIILVKLPNSIQLHISRKLGKDNWNVEEFLKCVNEEITARENCDLLKLNGKEESPETNNYTTSSLFTEGKEVSCVFCGERGHCSDKCEIVNDVNSRVEKLKEMRCCFNCLRPSHMKRDCKKSVKCYLCKGKHHTALYFKQKEKHSSVSINENHVLLQTATGFIANVKEKQEEETRIVFDSSSQQTYIMEEIAKKLKLTPVRTLRLNIKPFGKGNDEIVKANEYYVCIKPSETIAVFTSPLLQYLLLVAPSVIKTLKLSCRNIHF